MRAVLQEYLAPHGGASPQVAACQIANLRHRDGSRGTVQYDVRILDPASGETRTQTITGLTYGGERTRRVWDVIRAALEAQPESLTAAGLRPFAYVPELDVLLQVFPHDHRLPALAPLMTAPPADLLRSLLREFGGGSWDVMAWEPKTIQYRADMRAIVQIDLSAQDRGTGRTAAQRVFAKVYRDGVQAEQAFRAQRDLYAATMATESALSVAKPVMYAHDQHTLITAALTGVSLSRIIRGGEDVEPAVRAAARATAALHGLEVRAPERHINAEMAQLREAAGHLAEVRPDRAGQVSEMVDAIAAGLADAPMAPIHGDLKPDHMLVDGDRVALIDFDLMAMADPMADIAHFAAFLAVPQERGRKRAGNLPTAADTFLDEYFRHAPESGRQRLRLYHAATSIHKAVGVSRRRGAGRGARLEDVLAEGQALLDASPGTNATPSFKRRITRAPTR